MSQTSGTLYLIPTPLGEFNCAEVLPRPVIQVTRRLGHFIAENPKSARAFLKAIDAIEPLEQPLQQIKITRLNVSTPQTEIPFLLEPLLNGEDAGLVSEAGAPAVADPGALLVRLAHASGISVRPLVGPSSILLALMACGLDGQRFAFHGYLPTDPAARGKELGRLERESKSQRQTQIFIETPYRNDALLEACLGRLNHDTLLCVCSDLTLASEQIRSKTVAAWQAAGRVELKNRPAIFLLLAP